MKMPKLYILFFCGLCAVLACKKDKPENSTQAPGADNPTAYKFIIHLSADNRLLGYKKYSADTLLLETNYTYTADSITSVTSANNTVTAWRVYRLKNGVIATGTDSSFSKYSSQNNGMNSYTYKYQGNKLVERDLITTDTVNYRKCFYEYSGGNLSQTAIEYYFQAGGHACYDSYQYTAQPAFMDIYNFEFNIIKCTSQHLPQKITYCYGCPGGPSFYYPNSVYKYVLDRKNRVIKRVETYTWGTSGNTILGSQKEVTLYEYLID